jgi:alcohol dehydrogenase
MSLVNATPTTRLLRLVESGILNICSLVSHRMYLLNASYPSLEAMYCFIEYFPSTETITVYETFKKGISHRALKVAVDFCVILTVSAAWR